MKVFLGTLFLTSILQFNVYAQSDVSFSADLLQEMAQRYSGNALNWPVLVKLADHDIPNNKFVLTPSDIAQLENLSETSLIFDKQQGRIKALISQGATVFAKKEMGIVNSKVTNYYSAVNDGDLEKILSIGTELKPATDSLEASLNRNRLVNVQAQLSKKEGTVDKRSGLLSSWLEALEGDLFQESDAIKTHIESFATLSFTDGSNILIDASTTAVIRKSRIDRLNESSDTEITLVEGGLLSKLSTVGREKSNYILNAGASTTELKTQNFYAENSGGDNVKLTNYDGNASVTANDITITINKNEGTIIRGNNAPLPPIKLLAAPELQSVKRDTIIYADNFIYAFKAVPKATKYHIQSSQSYNFDKNVIDSETNLTRIKIEKLPLGTTYLKVQSIDNLGLRGPYSETLRVIRNVDTKAPPIFGDQLKGSILFTKSDSFTLQGVTEPDAKVALDGKTINVSKSGAFTAVIPILSDDQSFVITSVDNSMNKSEKKVRLVKLTPEFLFNITLNGAKISSEVSSSSTPITITGKAYPEMEVIISNNDIIKTVKTDSQGRWGVTMSMQEGKLSITLKAVNFEDSISTKSYIVK